ncbi:MAG TPA: MlaD family protein, partial [Kofleriaceae bacterium]|nr:MlaD family protein [Kofleriaceae bacterium]
MSELDDLPVPQAHRHKRGRPSAVWIVPILAIVAGGGLAIRSCLRSGPTIHITFDTADGLEAGKSDVRYKNVPVGKVEHLEVSDDHQHIIATVKLDHGAASLAASD